MSRNWKKIMSVILAAGMMVSMAACGSKPAETEVTEAQSAQADEKTDSQAAGGTLVMATNAEFPPYEYREGDEIVGIDVDMARAVAEKLGMTLEVEDMAFDSILVAVQSGKADMGVAGMTVTEDRLNNCNFSDTYAEAAQVIIVKEDSEIATPDDLVGKTVGVQLGTTGDIYAEDIEDGTVERYNKGFEAVQALTQGKIDAVVIDDLPAQEFVKQSEGLKILDGAYSEEEYALCFEKENQELCDQFNDVIQELKDDGTFEQIANSYIGDSAGENYYESPEDVDRSNGTLVMATNAEFPPYEYYEGEDIVGLDADFAQAIADKLGMDLKIEDMAFDSIIPAVTSGKADFGAAGMTVTEEREQQVLFSDTYYTARQVIIVKE